MITGQMRVTLSVEQSDNLALQLSLSNLGCCIEHVKWRVTSVELNGIEHGFFDVYLRFDATLFAVVFELLNEYTVAKESEGTTRVRNVMAKNVQHGMRVEFPNGQIGEVNQWCTGETIKDGGLLDVIRLGAPGGLKMDIEPHVKIRVHPEGN